MHWCDYAFSFNLRFASAHEGKIRKARVAQNVGHSLNKKSFLVLASSSKRLEIHYSQKFIVLCCYYLTANQFVCKNRELLDGSHFVRRKLLCLAGRLFWLLKPLSLSSNSAIVLRPKRISIYKTSVPFIWYRSQQPVMLLFLSFPY